MAGFKLEVGIRKAIRVVKKEAWLADKKEILRDTALKIQKQAQANSRKITPGPSPRIPKGYKTNRLANSIKIQPEEGFTSSPKGFSLSLRIYADTAMTPMGNGGSYATVQEFGSGIYATGDGASGDWIKPRGKRAMFWLQPHPPYKGRYVQAVGLKSGGKSSLPTQPTKRPNKSGRRVPYRMQFNVYKQIALKVRGSKPKHFLATAATKEILNAHANAIRQSRIKHIEVVNK